MPKSVANRIVREADGTLTCPECGCILSDTRSHKHLKAFFAFIRFAFDNWPEESTFTPDNPEHLRAYLLVATGHREPHHLFRFANKREQQIVMGFVQEEMRSDRARGRYGWPTIMDGGLVILRPASIAFDKISEKTFCKISEAVFAKIEEHIGVSFEEWNQKSPKQRRAA